ncbi:hypothetical protein ACMFMG_006597 [Clarireedia jacksonii]
MQDEVLLDISACEQFVLEGKYRCPCGADLNIKCDRKKRLTNAIWRILSMVGVAKQSGHSLELPPRPPGYISSNRSHSVPENASGIKRSYELPVRYSIQHNDNRTELNGESVSHLLELDAPDRFELFSPSRHSSRHISYSSMGWETFTDVQETNVSIDLGRARNSMAPVSATPSNISQLPFGDRVPHYSPTHKTSYAPSQDQRTTSNGLDLVYPQISWASSNESARHGTSFESVPSYVSETAHIWTTPTTSQGSYDESNALQRPQYFSADDIYHQTQVTKPDAILESGGPFEQGIQLNFEKPLDTASEFMNDLTLAEILQKPYTQQEIGAGMDTDKAFLDQSLQSPTDDKNCCLEHGHSCFTSSTIRSFSRYWENSKQLIDDFETAHSVFLRDIQLKLPGIEAAKSFPKLLDMSRNPTVCLELGLNVFREILKGRKKPDTIEDAFAFLTTVYASAAVIYNDLTPLKMELWFQEASSWVAGIGNLSEQEPHLQVIAGFWQVRFGTSAPHTGERSRAAASLSIEENNCVRILQILLDVLDHLRFNESHSRAGSFASSFTENSNFIDMVRSVIFEELRKNVEVQPYIENINIIEMKVVTGSITDSRRVEIELINVSFPCDTPSRLKFYSLVRKLCDKLYAQEGWVESPRTDYQIEGIKQLLEMVSDARGNDIEALVIPDLTNRADIWEDSLNPKFNLDPFASSPSQSSSQDSLEPPTSPTSSVSEKTTGTRLKCPFCSHIPKGDWSKGNLKRHINEKHSIKDGSLTCNYNGCKTTFTRHENLKTHQRDIHRIGPAKKTRRKFLKVKTEQRKSSMASVETASSADV